MRNFFILVILIIASQNIFAAGGIWILEIEYEANHQRAHGYIMADHWASNFEKDYLGKDEAFTLEFKKQYAGNEYFAICGKLRNLDYLNGAPFPFDPFGLVRSSKVNVRLEDIESVSLKKVWVKSDYMIILHSKIGRLDAAWCKGPHAVEHLGEGAGCRLEIYRFDGEQDTDKNVLMLLELYKPKLEGIEIDMDKMNALVNRLTEQKVIVVEMCGC